MILTQTPKVQTEKSPEDLINIFNALFQDSYHTVLAHSSGEPLYLPGERGACHQVLFAHGYFASALHEVAHWCVAGARRRKLLDFGYWYLPDGRTDAQQAAFEQVEVKPQALEWLLSEACDHRFRFSADNLSGEPRDMRAFQDSVLAQVKRYLEQLPKRAAQLIKACQDFYQTPDSLSPERYLLQSINEESL